MPTANLTWTNKSTTLNPTSTKVERSDGFTFGHPSAPAPVELDNSATGGLDPLQANGSYADPTVVPGNFYSYRVSTLKGSESASSLPSELKYIEDRVYDLGYPGGAPDTTSTYSTSVAPFLHMDVQRMTGGYVDGTPNVPVSNSSLPIDAGFDGLFRHNPLNWALSYHTYNSIPSWSTHDFGDGPRHFIANPQGGTQYLKLGMGDGKECPDGFTAFYVIDMHTGVTGLSTGFNVAGYQAASSGIHYKASGMTNSSFNTLGSINAAINFTHADNGVAGTTPAIHLVAMRLNNSLTAFNTGEIRAQAFDGGDVIGMTENRVGVSYHNGASSPSNANNLGATFFPSYADNPTGYIDLFSNIYQQRHFAELLFFDEALSTQDMNMVFGYLGNKFSIVPTVLADADMVNPT